MCECQRNKSAPNLVGLRVKSYGGHFVFCSEEFLSKCVVGGLENCEFKM